MGRSAHIRARRRRRARLSGRLQEEQGARYITRVEMRVAAWNSFTESKEREKAARAMELVKYPVRKAPR